MQDRLIAAGTIAGLYGVKGWLKIMSYTRPAEQLLQYSPWQVEHGTDQQKEFKVREGKVHGKGLIVALEGITDRDSAALLAGADIYIKRSQLQVLPEHEFYQIDLLNMQVINQQGRLLGSVKEILETGANEVLVVEGQERHLIPWVWDRYITRVDMNTGMIHVDWDPEWDKVDI